MLKLLIAVVLALVSLGCTIVILVEMFRDEIWKGLVGLFCGIYFLWYAVLEFEHDRKWPIVIGSLLGGTAASLLIR